MKTKNGNKPSGLNINGTESRRLYVKEWSPGRPTYEQEVREVVVWTEGRFQMPIVKRAELKEVA